MLALDIHKQNNDIHTYPQSYGCETWSYILKQSLRIGAREECFNSREGSASRSEKIEC